MNLTSILKDVPNNMINGNEITPDNHGVVIPIQVTPTNSKFLSLCLKYFEISNNPTIREIITNIELKITCSNSTNSSSIYYIPFDDFQLIYD